MNNIDFNLLSEPEKHKLFSTMQEKITQSTFYEIQVQEEIGDKHNCLTFNINGKLFKFAYYFKGDNFNVVFNGDNDQYPDTNNIYNFKFYSCSLKEVNVPFPERNPAGQLCLISTLDVDKLEEIPGSLNHITLHPMNLTEGGEKNLQKINLHLNNNGEILKESTLNMDRLSEEEDEPLTFFIKNSYLNNDNNLDDFTLISLSRKFRSEFENAFAFSRKITINIPKNTSDSKKNHFESFKFHYRDDRIPEKDDFTLFVIKNLSGYQQLDDGDKNIHASIGKEYLKTLLKKVLDDNKNGLVIIGNPEYCSKKKENFYVGFLN